jgi:hypothetical protein
MVAGCQHRGRLQVAGIHHVWQFGNNAIHCTDYFGGFNRYLREFPIKKQAPGRVI